MSGGPATGERGAAATDPPVRALLLDVDDTLLDTRTAMLAACRAGARTVWPQLASEAIDAFAREFYDDAGGCFDRYASGELSFSAMRERRFRLSADRRALPAADFDAFEAAYAAGLAWDAVLFADVEPLLERAAARSIGTCLLTNSSTATTEAKLAGTGIGGGAAPLVTTDTLGFGKPDPRMFHHACALLGVAPHEALVVGDTLGTDIEGARGAGCRAAWLQRPGMPPPRDSRWGTPIDDPGVTIVASLEQVAALL